MNTNRKTIRLKGYDYSQSGWYFVTVCTENRKRLFGNIINENMVLNECGKMIESIWQSLPKRFPVVLDAFQIMPNHIHMIMPARTGGFMPARTGGFMPAHGERTTNNDGWGNPHGWDGWGNHKGCPYGGVGGYHWCV